MRCAASCSVGPLARCQVSWAGVRPPRSSCALFRSRSVGKQERIAAHARRQQAGCHFALLLEDHVGESAAVDGKGDGGAQQWIRKRAGVGDLERKQGDRRGREQPEVILLRLPQLLGRNFDNVGVARR